MRSYGTELHASRQLRPRIRTSTTSLLLIGFSLFYFADVFLRASEKYFWYDELFTLYVCRLPTFHDILNALRHAVDFNPPLFYVLTDISKTLFGENLIGMRLPEIIGFWIFCLCLFRFVNRRAGPSAGFVAMILPMLTGAFYYAYEARAYGMVLGFCGLALVSWQNVVRERHQPWWLVAFSLSLAAAFMSHCYALLLAVPFAVVEVFRVIRFRRLDWGMWIALIAPTFAAGLMYVALLRSFGSLVQGTNFMSLSPPIWAQVASFYLFLLSPSILMVFAAVVLLLLNNMVEFHFRSAWPERASDTMVLEILVAVAFLTIPAVAVLLAKIVGGPFFTRYCISAVAGLSILLGFGLGRRNSANWLATALAVIMGFMAARQVAYLASHRYHGRVDILKEPSSGFSMNVSLKGPLDQYSLLMSQAGTSLPIGILEPLDFLYLVNYAPELVPRLYYIKGAPNDFFYRGFQNLRPSSPIKYNPDLTREDFLRLAPFSFIYGTDRVTQLAAFFVRGAQIQSLAVSNGHFLAELKGTLPERSLSDHGEEKTTSTQ